MLHPAETPRKSFLEQTIGGAEGPFIAASDYVRAVPEQLDPWIPGGMYVLGTDGMGRSDTRENLRRHFEIDAQSVTLAALYRLQQTGQLEAKKVAAAIRELQIDPEKEDPMFA
jgi:pyruvate dehydrogenase E1 component